VQRLLLVLTIAGFVVPNALLVAFIAGEGLDVSEYVSHWAEGLPSVQATLDLVIAALAFFAWAAVDGPRSGVRRWWIAIPASLLVGLCFGLPLYLYMRERALTPAAAPPAPAPSRP
jgi:hypothetical protein